MGKGKKTKNKNEKQRRDSSTEPDPTTSSLSKKQEGKDRRGRRKKQHSSSNKVNNAKDDLILRQYIEGDGNRTILEMNSDGNCLFRAVADQLYYDHGQAHADVRHEICDYLQEHESFFSLFLDLDDGKTKGEDASDFADYVRSMRQDGEWGGHLELVAAARLYRRCIRVFASNLAAMTISYDDDDSSDKATPNGPELLLSYHDNDHYNSVRDIRSRKGDHSKPPLPSRKTLIEHSEHTVEVEDCPGNESVEVTANGDASLAQAMDNRSSNNHEFGSRGEQSAVRSDETSTTDTTSSEKIENFIITKKAVVKGAAPCPCGSGSKYKKCCKNKVACEVREQRRQRGQPPPDEEKSDEETNNAAMVDQHATMDGKFRVLSI